MNPSNISIHIEKAIIRVAPNGLPASIIDVSANEVIKPAERFELVLDGQAVMDHRTGLMWWNDESDKLDWDKADLFCKSITVGGFSDWFMPSDEQMLTIVDRKLHNPCLPSIFKTHGEYVWTSTQTKWTEGEAGDSRSFWSVYLLNGYVYDLSAYGEFRARPVRVAAPAGQ
ncbi:DUF1566 domain-containing protein [Dyella sp.]|uniref:Lcl C-terminal domain-containing protein n=1 Tax=Dyella sp. TaxID=1869338 RepID=UPI002FDB14C1